MTARLTVFVIIVNVVVVVHADRREQQIQFLFEREHFAVNLRAVRL